MEQSQAVWLERQEQIARLVCHVDRNDWHRDFQEDESRTPSRDLFFAGSDVSFSTQDDNDAVATLTVVRLDSDGKSELVFSQSRRVLVQTPYVPGFLAFREAPIINDLLSALDCKVRNRIDCLLLDGNGVLHPRKAGLACHVGVENGLSTIGVSKNLLCVDGLDEQAVRAKALRENGVEVIGDSGFVWGRALITGNATSKPIYVSVGHQVSLETATQVVKRLCTFRIPDPIRYADLHSRAFLRGEHNFVYKRQYFS